MIKYILATIALISLLGVNLWLTKSVHDKEQARLEKIEQRLWLLDDRVGHIKVELDWLWKKKLDHYDLKEFSETGQIKRLSN